MAITGISAISGEQIIAAGAVSAKEAAKASFTTGGNDIQNLYDTVSTNSGSWTSTPITFPLNVTNQNVYVAKNSDTGMPHSAVASNMGLSSYFIVDAGRPRQIDYTGTVNYNGLSLETVEHYTQNTANANYGVTGISLSDNNNSENIDIASIQNWNSTHDTVSANSAAWGAGADYSAGKNISIAGNVVSTTDTISVTGDVQVENSTETEVTSVTGTIWGTNYYGHYASLNSSYKVTVSGTPSNLGVYVYDFDHGGYYVNGLTTADIQNFTISGLSSLPNAVTSKQGDWSTTDWFEGAEFGIQDPSYNPGYDPGMPNWPVSSTLYSLVGSNISLSGLNNFIETNSASWTASGPSYTGDAQGALDEVYSKSANWDGSYDTLTANSANWTAAGNTLGSNSGKWNQTYTAVTGNSATWGGSVLNVSAGPGVKINLVDDTLVFSNDETVLYDSSAKWTGITFSEPASSFERIKLIIGATRPTTFEYPSYAFTNNTWPGGQIGAGWGGKPAMTVFELSANSNGFNVNGGWHTESTASVNWSTLNVSSTWVRPIKVWGINRTAGNS